MKSEGRAGDLAEAQVRAGVAQVVDHLHRVAALLLGLLEEELRQPRERQPVVERADRRVLVCGGELAGDLVVEGVYKTFRRHGSRLPVSAAQPRLRRP